MVEKIQMDVNETLELEYLIEQISDSAISIDEEPTSGSSSVDYIARKNGVFNPTETGIHKLSINGQTVEIDVTDIPDSGLVYEYDIRSEGLNDGTTVSSLTDQEGSNNLSATGDPTASADQVNGNDTVLTDGVDDYFSGAAWPTGSDGEYTVAVLIQTADDVSNLQSVVGDSDNNYRLEINSSEWQATHPGNASISGGSVSTGTAYVVVQAYDGRTDDNLFLDVMDSNAVSANPGGKRSPSGPGYLSVRGGNQQFAKVYHGQARFYDQYYDDGGRQSIIDGLRSSWGI